MRQVPGFIVLASLLSAAPRALLAGGSANPPATATAPAAALSPAVLPGKGLGQHPFLYTGEWDTRRKEQMMSIVREGKVVWSYSIPLNDADGTLEELGDATLLSNGNIAFCRKIGFSIIAPDKKILWSIEAPKGTEMHSIQPLGTDRVLIMQNGNPAKAMTINILTGKVEKEVVLPTGNPAFPHMQFRRVRLTKAGTYLAGHLDMNKVSEYDDTGKEIWTVKANQPWSVVRLNNGNTLIGCSAQGVKEVNPKGETVWDFTQKDVPDIKLFIIQEVSRLANGNTVLCNWCPNGLKNAQDWANSVQVLEVTPEKKVVWALRSWSGDADLGPASSIQLLDEPGIPEKGEQQR